MKTIWWPFCLLMLSRRIMRAGGLEGNEGELRQGLGHAGRGGKGVVHSPIQPLSLTRLGLLDGTRDADDRSMPSSGGPHRFVVSNGFTTPTPVIS